MHNEQLRRIKLGVSAFTVGLGTIISPAGAVAAPTTETLSQTSEIPSSPETVGDTESLSVPVFYNETEIRVDFPSLYKIDSETNLREDTSTNSEIVQKLLPGYVIRESETPIVNAAGENWYPATVEFDGTSVVTETVTGNLREDVRGTRLDSSEIPQPLQQNYIDQAKRENNPPISLSGEFSITATLDEIQNEGGDDTANSFIADLFHEPSIVEDANGQNLTFVERAASGTDLKATLDYATGLHIYTDYLLQHTDDEEETTSFSMPHIWSEVNIDEKDMIQAWQAVPYRMPAIMPDGKIVDYFYYRNATLGENNDQNNALLSYQELMSLIGKDAAQLAARSAFVIPGLRISNEEVVAEKPDEVMQTLLADVDSIYIPKYGLVSIPGNQEIVAYLNEGQEVGSINYKDKQIVVTDAEGNEAVKLHPIVGTSGEVEWRKVEEPPVYDNEYLANLLRTKKMEEFDDGPMQFERYLETADTHLIFPIGGENGFDQDDAEMMKQLYDQVYELSPSFKEFMDTTPRVRSYINFIYPSGRDVLSSPNYLRGYLLEQGQEMSDQEAKKTYGYLYFILSEYSLIEEWASRFAGSVDNLEEFEKGLVLMNWIHEFWRTHSANQSSIVGLDDEDPQQLELMKTIRDELKMSGLHHQDFFAGIDENIQHLRSTID